MELVINKPTVEGYFDLIKTSTESLFNEIFWEYSQVYKIKYNNLHEYLRNCATLEGLKDFVLKQFIPEDSQGLFNFKDSVISQLSLAQNLRNIKEGDRVVVISEIKADSGPVFLTVDGVNKTNKSFMFRNSDRSASYISANDVISEKMFDNIRLLIAFGTERLVNEDREKKEKEALIAVDRLKKNRVRKYMEDLLLRNVVSDFTGHVENCLIEQKPNIFQQTLKSYIKLNPLLRINIYDIQTRKVEVRAIKKDMSDWNKRILLIKDGDLIRIVNLSDKKNKTVKIEDYYFIEEKKFKELEKMALIDSGICFMAVVRLFVFQIKANILKSKKMKLANI